MKISEKKIGTPVADYTLVSEVIEGAAIKFTLACPDGALVLLDAETAMLLLRMQES